MAAKERNPLKIMAIIQLCLMLGLIVVVVFINQKTDGSRVGYFLPEEDAAPTTTPSVTPSVTV